MFNNNHFLDDSQYDTDLYLKCVKVSEALKPQHYQAAIRYFDLAIDAAKIGATTRHIFRLRKKVIAKQERWERYKPSDIHLISLDTPTTG